jgi:hypothetical protein
MLKRKQQLKKENRKTATKMLRFLNSLREEPIL